VLSHEQLCALRETILYGNDLPGYVGLAGQ